MNFWQRAQQFPPVLVRLLARHRSGPPLSAREIADRSKLTPYQVMGLSESTDWAGVDLVTMRKFLVACEVDFENVSQMRRVDAYLRKATWQYLRTSPDWKALYSPLMRIHRAAVLNKTKPNPNYENTSSTQQRGHISDPRHSPREAYCLDGDSRPEAC